MPDSPHAVSVCMPTWRDNVGYEEGDPRVANLLENGYPRFLYNRLCRDLFEVCRARFAGAGEASLAFSTRPAAERFATFLTEQAGCPVSIHDFGMHGVHAACFPESDAGIAKLGWQHLGEGVSSRLAEACLTERTIAEGGTAKTALKLRIAGLAGASADDVFLFPYGMTAIYAVHRVLCELSPQKKCVQFGFPYVDTLKLQKKFGGGVHFFPRGNVEELDELAAVIQAAPISGIYTEFPSNPLLKSPDLKKLAKLAEEHGCPLIVDDTIATFANADLLPVADAVCTSLTKFFSGAGDVAGGSVVLNRSSPFYDELSAALRREADELLWCEDAQVLEQNARDFEQRIARINETAETLADHLQGRPEIESVHYPKFQSPEMYEAFRRPGGGYSGLLSVVLANSAENAPRFFDALRVCKGPNLGTNFTLACPFTILAHFEELDFAESCGVSRYLIRISVGLEDASDLIARFDEALATL